MSGLTVKLPPLHVVQQKVVDRMRRFTILRIGRQAGKSFLASLVAVKRANDRPNQTIIVVAPTFKQTQAIYGRIRKLIKPLMSIDMGDGTMFATEYKADLRIEFHNGSTIMAASSDNPDKLRGYTIDLIIFDEAASMDNGPELWFEVVRPALAVTRGDAMFLSTPKGKDNWFYDLWKYAESDIAEKNADSDWAIFHFKSTDSPYFPEEEGEAIRAVGENYYLQECEAEFTATRNRIIGPENFHHYEYYPGDNDGYFQVGALTIPKASTYRVMAVDLAVSQRTTADFTAMAIGDMDRRGLCFVRDVYRDRILGPNLATSIRDRARQQHCNVVYVENVAFQLSVIQELQMLGVTVQPQPAKGDKIARVSALGIRMEAGQTLYPQHATWLMSVIDELTAFPDARYDDQADALAYLSLVSADYAMNTGSMVFGSVTLDQVAAHDDNDDQELYRANIRAEKMAKRAAANVERGNMSLERMRGPM